MSTKQTTIQAPSLSAINPLIEENGDTSKVSATLDFVARALTEGSGDQGRIVLTAGQAFGLFVIVDMCSTALKEML